MLKRNFYDKIDYDRINCIIKTLGESKRQMKLDYVQDVTNRQYPAVVKERIQESWQYYDCIINWLVEDVKLLRKYNTLVELTEEGMRLYEENNGIEAYIKNMREEKRLVVVRLKREITHKSILIVTSVIVLISTFASCFANDFWSGLLSTLGNIVFGALVAIACQLVKPLRKLFNPYGID